MMSSWFRRLHWQENFPQVNLQGELLHSRLNFTQSLLLEGDPASYSFFVAHPRDICGESSELNIQAHLEAHLERSDHQVILCG